MSNLIGEIAALATSVLWASSSTFFTLGGKRQSPQMMNRWRLIGALFLLGLFHLIIVGSLVPSESLLVWLILALSGIIGLSVGDGLLFWSYLKVGPRVSMLVMSLGPIVTTSVAWLMMDETLSWYKIIAIGITLSGVSWVVTDRKNGGSSNRSPFRITTLGLLLAFGGMLGQAIQILLAKDAMSRMISDNPPLTATYIRIFWGAVSIWFATIVLQRGRRSFSAFRDKGFILWVSLATFFGPFLGIWASFIAVDNAPIGVASTLMALPPLLMIPISFFVFKERPTYRSVIGTVVCLIGVSMIFLL
ncbi:MAG: DMT family transporter [Candidatus Thermoplasmatota archaeon]|nr:DMT family transporter [Candidatus Thermoplasmatota archaeon]